MRLGPTDVRSHHNAYCVTDIAPIATNRCLCDDPAKEARPNMCMIALGSSRSLVASSSASSFLKSTSKIERETR